MSKYQQYLSFIEEQGKKAKTNFLMQQLLNLIDSNKEYINDDIADYIFSHIEKNINLRLIIKNTKAFIRAEKIKRNEVDRLWKSLSKIVKERENTSFPKASVKDVYLKRYSQLSKELKVLVTDDIMKLIKEQILTLKKSIINDLKERDKALQELQNNIIDLNNLFEERKNKGFLAASIQQKHITKFNKIKKLATSYLNVNGAKHIIDDIKKLKEEIVNDLKERDKSNEKTFKYVIFGIIGIILTIIFWDIAKWIFIIIAIIIGVLLLSLLFA